MYDHQIRKIFKNCKHFIGVYPRDLLPAKIKIPCGLIVNTDKSKNPGTHWVAITILMNGKGEYFDSFGFPPMYEEIKNFLDRNCPNGWCYSSRIIQHPMTSSCGYYSVAFLINRFNNVPFVLFLNNFCRNIDHNEKILFDKLNKKWDH